jgi:hypothetical protein
MNEWMHEWMHEWMNEWKNSKDSLFYWHCILHDETIRFQRGYGPVVRQNEWMNEWMHEWMHKWMHEWMNEWNNSKDSIFYWHCILHDETICFQRGYGPVVRQWMHEWMNERMNECMNEWMNERIQKTVFFTDTVSFITKPFAFKETMDLS